MTIQIIPIQPQEMNLNIFEVVALKVLSASIDKTQDELLNLVSSWSSSSKPSFQKKTSKGIISIGGETFAQSGDLSVSLITKSTPYVYVIGGTKTRKRRMSDDYARKSFPNSIKTAPGGKGGPAGKPIYNLPGIQARNHHEIIATKKIEPALLKDMTKAFKVASAKLFKEGTGGASIGFVRL